MGLLTCAACEKVIDLEPARCPACHATQPDASSGAAGRRLERVAAVVGALVVGAFAGRASWTPPVVVAPFGKFGKTHDDYAASRSKVKQLVARLRKDSERPFAAIEDVMVRPQDYRGKPGSTVAMVFSVKASENRAILMTGWGTGSPMDADIGSLSANDRREMLRRHGGPNWAAFKGRWEAGTIGGSDSRSPGTYLRVESFESLGSAGVETLDQILDAP